MIEELGGKHSKDKNQGPVKISKNGYIGSKGLFRCNVSLFKMQHPQRMKQYNKTVTKILHG